MHGMDFAENVLFERYGIIYLGIQLSWREMHQDTTTNDIHVSEPSMAMCYAPVDFQFISTCKLELSGAHTPDAHVAQSVAIHVPAFRRSLPVY